MGLRLDAGAEIFGIHLQLALTGNIAIGYLGPWLEGVSGIECFRVGGGVGGGAVG